MIWAGIYRVEGIPLAIIDLTIVLLTVHFITVDFTSNSSTRQSSEHQARCRSYSRSWRCCSAWTQSTSGLLLRYVSYCPLPISTARSAALRPYQSHETRPTDPSGGNTSQQAHLPLSTCLPRTFPLLPLQPQPLSRRYPFFPCSHRRRQHSLRSRFLGQRSCIGEPLRHLAGIHVARLAARRWRCRSAQTEPG